MASEMSFENVDYDSVPGRAQIGVPWLDELENGEN